MKNENKNERGVEIFDMNQRLVRFAAESFLFTSTLDKVYGMEYYSKQLIRASGSSCLNYGEASGTISQKDFKYKAGICLKELKECRNIFLILNYLNKGELEIRMWLIDEVEQLIAIIAKMILNKG